MAELDRQAFTQRWIVDLLAGMDEHLGQETRARLMEGCGRECARYGPVRAAKACQGDLDAWLSTLRRWHGSEDHVRKEGNVVSVTCKECLCPVVSEMPGTLSDTYCYCSLGWMKETFGTVLGRTVDVELVQSIKRGAQTCEFAIWL